MSSGHTVTIAPADAHVEVRLGDVVLADSRRALRLDETGLPPRYYVPKDDVRMDLLEPTTFHTTCPFKGQASYWSVEVAGTRHDGLAWAYETPIDGATDIAGHLSFYPDRAEVRVDGDAI
ncbi:DUF427 domain-containing protein [Actinomarinicola tropica]|uniref:DUF427 domain-containing protein n=1 Tax=Actinomarinicola tropica TaxID=2789776 RepID=A0A5Q2RNN2_9ACTN|nr:DUF427 domain-containing protein [Actinomarinicola tropica]QGG94795.1 DUF427 domain-containing protein [Actinomarinicola tropica]